MPHVNFYQKVFLLKDACRKVFHVRDLAGYAKPENLNRTDVSTCIYCKWVVKGWTRLSNTYCWTGDDMGSAFGVPHSLPKLEGWRFSRGMDSLRASAILQQLRFETRVSLQVEDHSG